MTHHIAYQTIHKPTGRYYLGIHSTENLDDGYLGSGRGFARFRKGKPRSEFHRHIVKEFPTRAEACEWEEATVTEAVVEDPRSLNLKTGGMGNGRGRQGAATLEVMRTAAAGRTASPATLKRMSKSATRQWADPATLERAQNGQGTKVTVAGKAFRSYSAAGRFFGVADSTIHRWVERGAHGAKALPADYDGPYEKAPAHSRPRNGKGPRVPVAVGDDVFESGEAAAAALGVSAGTISKWATAGKHGVRRLGPLALHERGER